MPYLSEEEIDSLLPALKCVFYAAGSVQGFARPFLNRGVRVFSAWAANAVPVAEYATAQIILAGKDFYCQSRLGSVGRWQDARERRGSQIGNYHKRVGLIGCGMIGSMVAKRLKAFDVEVLAYDPFLSSERANELGVSTVTLSELFSCCEVVSNHLANNESTKRLLGYERFMSMPQEASNREASLSKSSIGEHIVLPDAMWSICKSENKAALAAKGGNNGEPHNHNDIGSFQYIFSGNNIVLDIGAGEYTGDYFGKNRYQTLCCRSLGHSVPIINGSEQLPGANHCATLFEADGRGRTVIGLERAYKLSKGDRVRRILDFDLLSGRLRITDDFSISKGGSITENLVLAYPPEILSDGFLVEAPSCVIRIKCENGRDFRIVEKSYTDHFGKNAVVWLAQWSLTENRAVICFDPEAL